MGSQAAGPSQGQMGPQQMGPPAPPPQGGKPGGAPGGQPGKMQQLMGGMAGAQPPPTQMPVDDPAQMQGIGDFMKAQTGQGPPPGGPQGGKPGGGPPGGPPGAGGPGNPNSSAPMPEFGGMPGQGGNQFPGLPQGMPNRWGPGSSAGPGIPGPYERMNPNDYMVQKPEGFSQSLIDVADKGKIAPHDRTAQSYGPSPIHTQKKKKGGK